MSPWHKRGWIFQEGVLSYLLVHFTHYGIYIVDRHQTLIHQEGSRLTVRDHVLAMTYWRAVFKYTTRTLSHESDILEAFTGFLNDSFPSAHYFGLPRNISMKQFFGICLNLADGEKIRQNHFQRGYGPPSLGKWIPSTQNLSSTTGQYYVAHWLPGPFQSATPLEASISRVVMYHIRQAFLSCVGKKIRPISASA